MLNLKVIETTSGTLAAAGGRSYFENLTKHHYTYHS